MILSRVQSISLALVLVLTASLSQAAPAAAAGAVSSSAARAPAFSGLFGDLFAFFSYLGEMFSSMFGGGGDSKGGHNGGLPPGGEHSDGEYSTKGSFHFNATPPGPSVPPVDWDNDWDGNGHKDSRDLWKKLYL